MGGRLEHRWLPREREPKVKDETRYTGKGVSTHEKPAKELGLFPNNILNRIT